MTRVDPADWEALTGPVEVVTPDRLAELAEQAKEQIEFFREAFQGIIRPQALWVRHLRCELRYTYRAIATASADIADGDWQGNQLAGMAMCERAAEKLGEDSNEEPWN